MLSVEAVHENVIEWLEAFLTSARFVGTVGAWVSPGVTETWLLAALRFPAASVALTVYR